MQNILVAECSAVAVFEPLLGGLVATDAEIPCFDRDGVEVLLVVDPNTALVIFCQLEIFFDNLPVDGVVTTPC